MDHNKTNYEGVVVVASEKITSQQVIKKVYNLCGLSYKRRKKGSLQIVMLAEIVILNRYPLKLLFTTIKDIEVLKIIKEGVSLYKKK